MRESMQKKIICLLLYNIALKKMLKKMLLRRCTYFIDLMSNYYFRFYLIVIAQIEERLYRIKENSERNFWFFTEY